MNKTISAIIFDLYGVLALNGWQAFKTKHFTDHPDLWHQVFLLGRQVDAGLTDYEELIRFTAKKTEETEDTVRHQLEHTAPNVQLLSYINDELKHSFKLGILSNASSNKVLDQVFSANEIQLFDAVTLSHHVGLTKPDTRMYEAAAKRLGVNVSDCLFVDDQEQHVEGAHKAGMQTLLYKNFSSFKKEMTLFLSEKV